MFFLVLFVGVALSTVLAAFLLSQPTLDMLAVAASIGPFMLLHLILVGIFMFDVSGKGKAEPVAESTSTPVLVATETELALPKAS
ncbi:MAG TPA: hypothetical protein VEX38_03235 [Fimbriimonadaceae bacterium]|nr:hypothetical protein [Fimbriimonadaceae bacterium]